MQNYLYLCALNEIYYTDMRHTRQLLVMIFALCLALVMRAQTTLSVSPVTSTEGYDFVATFLPNGSAQRNAPDLKLQFLVSSRAVPGHPEITENVVTVQCGTYREDFHVPVNSVLPIDIKPDLAYWDIAHEKDQVEKPLTLGVHIYSKNGVKMTVYAINQIGTDKTTLSLDGSHLLPKQAWGHEYIVSCNREDNIATEFVVMSTAAGTEAKIQLPDNVKTSKGSTGTITAKFTQAYQVYIVRAAADPEKPDSPIDLSGAKICADRPVAVWSGNQAARFTTDLGNATADHAFDQLLPIDRWGSQFIVPMTGHSTRLNKLDVIAREEGTKVTITTSRVTQTQTLGSGAKWERLVDAYHGQESSFQTLADSVLLVKADKPVEVYLHTSSAVYNLDKDIKYHGDPSMTMISPLEHLTDTAVFTTYENQLKDVEPMSYELVLWAKETAISTLQRNGRAIPASSFKALPGNVFPGYKYARISIPKEEEGYQILTSKVKGFGGYICGMENGQAVLYPVGYDFQPYEDSLFLSKKYEPKEVHGADFNAKYPDKASGGGWYLDKVVLPNLPTQYDTIFICDSTKLRFPAILHNDWDDIKWEVMRIDPSNKKRSEYTDDASVRQTGTLSNPFLETQFCVLPEKDRAAGKRHPFEDFEVRAVLYREPIMCQETDKEKWQKDTLSTIVRTYRSYNDTTWLIRCTNDDKEGKKDIVEKDGKYYIKFFKDPGATEPELTEIAIGENMDIPTHKYTTVHGCANDSVVTLRVLLCESEVETKEMYLCEADLEGIHSQLGGFFPTFDFAGTFEACKKNGNKGANGWTYLGDTKQYWQYKGSDVIRTTDCNSKMQEWNRKYGAAYPRGTIGCDRSLTLTLNVWPIIEYVHDDVTTCKNKYTWSFDYNWYDGHFTKHDEITYEVGKNGIHEGTNLVYSDYPRTSYPPDVRDKFPTSPYCTGERHILSLTFLKDNQVHKKNVELCQDDAPLKVNKTSDPDIADETYLWTFDPREHTPGTYNGEVIECINADGCPYKLQYVIKVNNVDIIRDTIVYCYEDGSQVLHQWEGHPQFWAYDKNKAGDKPKRYTVNSPLKINRPKADKTKDTRVIYELADTIFGTPCHTLHYQTVILLPPYSTSEKRASISTEQWFEWQNVIWAGENVDVSTIPSGGKQIVVLKEYGRVVPEGWTVEYLKGDYLYALTTTTTVHQYKRVDGSLTAACDSTVQLLVQVADVQREQTYAWVCSNETPYEWKAGDTIIYVNLEEQYRNVSELPKTIHLEEHRLTVDDPRKTVSPWPVAGIDAYFYRDLTIYPAYVTTEDTAVCQEIGKKIEFKGKTFSLDVADTLVAGNKLKTEPKYWTNPETGEDVEVRCDSIEGVRVFVHPIFTETVNKELSTYERTFYTHDTLTFFTDPKILYVGKDFLTVHPELSGLEELKRIAGVEEAVVIDETLVKELGDEGSKGGMYYTEQGSDGTKALGCDSTTYLEITVWKANVLPPVNLGDNGNVLDEGVSDDWKFGGDTTVARADGTRYHTFPLITGEYFQFYYNEKGEIIGKVDYYDPDNQRGSRDYHYSDNDDGTRTYLLIDTVLNADGSFSVYVQNLVVYPSFLVDANVSESLGKVEVCASDMYNWVGHFVVDVSTLDLNERKATVQDRMCAQRYADRKDSEGKPLCVDSVCILEMTVFGNKNAPQDRHQCFNWSEWTWHGTPIYYDDDAPISGQIRDTIKPKDFEDHDCYDVYVLNVIFDPAYGVKPYQGYSDRYHYTYVEPYIYDTVVCRFDEDFLWLRGDGKPYDPNKSNLYLYKYDGNENNVPDNRYTDAQGNATNKIPDNKVPTEFDFGFYTVRDSLKTIGCYCDSVLTLNYEIRDAMPPVTIDTTICIGEAIPFGDTIITTPGTYERYIQEEGKPCKTKFTLNLTMEKASSFILDPSPVCFGEANTESTYAIRYSYKGHHPVSFSVYYDDDAKELGFEDVINIKINRPESEWKADSVYVLDVPMPKLDSREDYPTPGIYHATIGFNNGLCFGEDLMSYPIEVKVNYPSWVMEQRHGDLIVLLDAAYNGGHAWKAFQWYRNGQKMFGYTKPYLYLPEGLIYESEQTAEYHVVLTEKDEMGEVISSEPTCPIVVQSMPNSQIDPGNDHGPSSDYIAVTPTCVPRGGSIHILSLNESSSGEYRINTVDGQFISKGTYNGKSTPVAIPSAEGMYIVQVWSSDKESQESYRAIKVIVKDTCPNCDKSSF